jgi:quinoprotein relay system zinc metallohydrolase 2
MSRAEVLTAISSILFFCTLPLSSSSAAASDSFELSEPAPGVFVHSGKHRALDMPGHDDIANIGFVVGKKCVAVIDTGGSLKTGRALRAAIRIHTLLPICFVINTHVHVDHVLGNFAFKSDRPSFVGSATLGEAIARNRDFFVKQYPGDLDQPPSTDQIIGPDRLVEQQLDLDLGNRHLMLRAWPTAHTDCDLSVYDAQTGTLWTGDLLFRELLPALDGSLKGWLSTIDELGRTPVKFAVPGHGPIARDLASALIPERRYLQALLDGVRSEIAEGKPMETAIAQVAYAEHSHWLLWEKVHPHNVARAYQELEWE